jgi:acyl-CoA reductase-like NAD-dependent aldehyde dehydrogenase
MSNANLLDSTTKFLGQPSIPLFIGGDWTKGNAGLLAVIDPNTGKAIANVSMADARDVDKAVRSAHSAFSSWSGMHVNDRAALLHRLAERVIAESETLAQLESLDVGKPIGAARGDVAFGADGLRYFADLSTRALYDVPLAIKNIEARTQRRPHGVSAFIIPWNFPFLLLCWGIAPALAAGNTVVVKQSEVTPLSALYFAKLAAEAGVPAGVINIITGTGNGSGQPLAEHPLVKHVAFTGSPGVGQKIAGLCGSRLVPCKLELGGKGAAVVFDDCDLKSAVTGLAGAITMNSGQVCCTATRWFLHERIFDEFVERVGAQLTAVKLGNSLLEDTKMGPMVSKAHYERVLGYYDKGIASGAKSIFGGTRADISPAGDGFYIKPHLLSGIDDNICFREEVFGPTAYVVKFSDETEAVARVNSIEYGLANSVWTQDQARANRVASAMIAGNSWINAHNVFAYGLPYGGVNLSGLGGGVNSPETFDDYLRTQTIARPL